MAWTDAYIGRPWVKDEYDCAVLLQDVARDRLGIEVVLPSERAWRRLPPDRLAELGADWARPAAPPLEEHDIALMKIKGHRASLGSHLGVLAKVGGLRVLHNLEGIGVLLTPLAKLPGLGLELVEWHRWIR